MSTPTHPLRWKSLPITAAIASLWLVCAPAAAAPSPGTPATPEIPVNQDTVGFQSHRDTATDAAGNFIVLWSSSESADRLARLFWADGTPRTDVFSVRGDLLAMNAAGEFVLVWSAPDPTEVRTFARVYNPDGTPRSGYVPFEYSPAGSVSPRMVRMAADGSFAIAAYAPDGSFSSGIVAQAFDEFGLPRGPAVQANTSTTGTQTLRQMHMNADGGFVLAWDDPGSSSDEIERPKARVFDADGVPVTAEFLASSHTSRVQIFGDMAMAADGDFVILWRMMIRRDFEMIRARSFRSDGMPRRQDVDFGMVDEDTLVSGSFHVGMADDGSYVVTRRILSSLGYANVYVRVQDAIGNRLTGEIKVNQDTVGLLAPIELAVDGEGNFVVLWGPTDAPTLYARSFAANGSPRGDQVLLSSTYARGHVPALVMRDGGDFLVSWVESGDAYTTVVRDFHADGSPRGPAFTTDSSSSSLRVDADGDYVVTWERDSDIFAQRVAGTEAVPLSLLKTDSVDPVGEDGALQYALTVTNAHAPTADPGVGLANGIVITDPLPPVLAYNGFSGPGWDCGFADGTVTCNHAAPLAPGASSTVTLDVTAPAVGRRLSNTATVAADQYDPVATDDSDTEITELSYCPPGTLQFLVADHRISEGNASPRIRVERVGGDCGQVGATWSATGSEATTGLDHLDATGALRWPDGQSGARAFPLTILQDTLDEDNERVELVLSAPTGGAVLGSPSVMRIVDDDPTPRVRIQSARTAREGQRDATFTLTLNAISGLDVVVTLGLGGSATRDVDYRFTGEQVTIPAGQLSLTRDLQSGGIDIINDVIDDDGEVIVLSIMEAVNANVPAAARATTMEILDDD